VACVSKYLNIPTNEMIIGVPGSDFPFPLAKLGGVRLAVPRSDPEIRQDTCEHLGHIIIDNPGNESRVISRTSSFARDDTKSPSLINKTSSSASLNSSVSRTMSSTNANGTAARALSNTNMNTPLLAGNKSDLHQH
jgi:hypothetical protein